MSFNGSEGEYVTLEDASVWTATHRENNPGAVKGHFLGKDKLNFLLGGRGCKGLRIYQAVDELGESVVVVVGVDSKENDQLGTGFKIVEKSSPCPPYCGNDNPLNS